MLPNCLNTKKRKKRNTFGGYNTIQHSIERSQTTKCCIQYNLRDTKLCEVPNSNIIIGSEVIIIICENSHFQNKKKKKIKY